jgi:hypothetical protein
VCWSWCVLFFLAACFAACLVLNSGTSLHSSVAVTSLLFPGGIGVELVYTIYTVHLHSSFLPPTR